MQVAISAQNTNARDAGCGESGGCERAATLRSLSARNHGAVQVQRRRVQPAGLRCALFVRCRRRSYCNVPRFGVPRRRRTERHRFGSSWAMCLQDACAYGRCHRGPGGAFDPIPTRSAQSSKRRVLETEGGSIRRNPRCAYRRRTDAAGTDQQGECGVLEKEER